LAVGHDRRAGTGPDRTHTRRLHTGPKRLRAFYLTCCSVCPCRGAPSGSCASRSRGLAIAASCRLFLLFRLLVTKASHNRQESFFACDQPPTGVPGRKKTPPQRRNKHDPVLEDDRKDSLGTVTGYLSCQERTTGPKVEHCVLQLYLRILQNKKGRVANSASPFAVQLRLDQTASALTRPESLEILRLAVLL
jgi:hypothetical protein